VKRIVFAAIVAFTDRPTYDGRRLIGPGTTACPLWEHAQYPLPVFVPGREKIGEIELASIVDHRLTVFGRLSTSPVHRRFIEPLLDGSARLEIEIRGGTTEFPEHTPEMWHLDWGLTCVVIGTNPCWDLPPVQIEEFVREVVQ
jgi:hypothetical protein